MAEALRELHRDYVNATQSLKTVVQNNGTQKRASFMAALLPLCLFSSFYVADATEFAWRVWSHVVGQSMLTFYRFELFVVPLLVGLTTGLLLAPKCLEKRPQMRWRCWPSLPFSSPAFF